MLDHAKNSATIDYSPISTDAQTYLTFMQDRFLSQHYTPEVNGDLLTAPTRTLSRTKRSKRTSDYSKSPPQSSSKGPMDYPASSSQRRDFYHHPRKRKHNCARHELYVDFDKIGWSGWIISPKGYNAYHCKGQCPFPLGQNQRPTNHATVQSIVHALRIGSDVSTPCCVPNKLYSISLLYFDEDENVILKQYDDMVAASCGCH